MYKQSIQNNYNNYDDDAARKYTTLKRLNQPMAKCSLVGLYKI